MIVDGNRALKFRGRKTDCRICDVREGHVELGLPGEKNIMEAIREAEKRLDVKIGEISVTQNVNLSLRYMYMSCWISRSKQIQRLYQLMIVLLHLRKLLKYK